VLRSARRDERRAFLLFFLLSDRFPPCLDVLSSLLVSYAVSSVTGAHAEQPAPSTVRSLRFNNDGSFPSLYSPFKQLFSSSFFDSSQSDSDERSDAVNDRIASSFED
jgi:hypothetical protein